MMNCTDQFKRCLGDEKLFLGVKEPAEMEEKPCISPQNLRSITAYRDILLANRHNADGSINRSSFLGKKDILSIIFGQDSPFKAA